MNARGSWQIPLPINVYKPAVVTLLPLNKALSDISRNTLRMSTVEIGSSPNIRFSHYGYNSADNKEQCVVLTQHPAENQLFLTEISRHSHGEALQSSPHYIKQAPNVGVHEHSYTTVLAYPERSAFEQATADVVKHLRSIDLSLNTNIYVVATQLHNELLNTRPSTWQRYSISRFPNSFMEVILSSLVNNRYIKQRLIAAVQPMPEASLTHWYSSPVASTDWFDKNVAMLPKTVVSQEPIHLYLTNAIQSVEKFHGLLSTQNSALSNVRSSVVEQFLQTVTPKIITFSRYLQSLL